MQVVTFGPGYAPAATIQPLSLAHQRRAERDLARRRPGDRATSSRSRPGNPHTLQVGDSVTIAGVAMAGYNGTFTVTSVPSTRSFTYTNPTAGLPTSGGGTVTLTVPGATESGTTVTITTAAAHGRSVGDVVTIAGVGVVGLQRHVHDHRRARAARSFQYTAGAAGLANSGGGTVTFFSPFQLGDRRQQTPPLIDSASTYTNANLTAAINAIPGFAGTATVTGAAATGFTVTYTGASAGIDVPNLVLQNLSCGGCFASVEETNHGGAFDSFTLNYNGTRRRFPIVNGANYTAAGIAGRAHADPPGRRRRRRVAGFGGGALNNTGLPGHVRRHAGR